MSLMDNGCLSAADVAAVTRNSGGFGNFGDGGFFWIIILFLFAIFGNGGWGNGFGGNGNAAVPLIMQGQQQSEVQRVVDQQSVMGGITALQAQAANGFSDAEISRCNMQTNLLQAINNNQSANAASFNGVNQGIADLKYVAATENCADRTLIQSSTRDVIENTNNKVQAVMDKLCQLELDNIKSNYEAQIRAMQQQNNQLLSDNQSLRFQASQGAQSAQILADNAAQTMALEQYLAPVPKPAYIVQNPNCCSQQYYTGCGCGSRMIG
ncbi:MAG: hypothetical protein J6U54_08845 [Clostridiales bacterium]|nr:hypothetical protein [Clostridiales bacterium]